MSLLRHVVIAPKVLFFLRLRVGRVVRGEGAVKGGKAATDRMAVHGLGILAEGGAECESLCM